MVTARTSPRQRFPPADWSRAILPDSNAATMGAPRCAAPTTPRPPGASSRTTRPFVSTAPTRPISEIRCLVAHEHFSPNGGSASSQISHQRTSTSARVRDRATLGGRRNASRRSVRPRQISLLRVARRSPLCRRTASSSTVAGGQSVAPTWRHRWTGSPTVRARDRIRS